MLSEKIDVPANFEVDTILIELSTIANAARSLRRGEEIQKHIACLENTQLWTLLEGAVPLLEKAHHIHQMCKEAATQTKAILLILERVTMPLQPQEGEKNDGNQPF